MDKVILLDERKRAAMTGEDDVSDRMAFDRTRERDLHPFVESLVVKYAKALVLGPQRLCSRFRKYGPVCIEDKEFRIGLAEIEDRDHV